MQGKSINSRQKDRLLSSLPSARSRNPQDGGRRRLVACTGCSGGEAGPGSTSAVRSWQDSSHPLHHDDSMSSLTPTPISTPRIARELSLKVVVLGDAMVGKTSLVQRYVNNIFQSSYKETIGVDFTVKVINWTPDLTIKLQFWDIAGNERMGTMTRAYYRNAQGCLVLFDLTDHSTFYRVPGWKEDLDSKCRLPDGSRLPCLLMANKSDLANEWSMTRDEMALLSTRLGFSAWRVVSVKDNVGVDEALSCLLQDMMGRGGQGQAVYSHGWRDSTSIKLSAHPRTPPSSPSSPSSSSCC